jgi:hypothetical protein
MHGVSVLRSADPLASAGASDHPPHLIVRGLESRYGWASQERTWWFHSPARHGGQVHQVD